MSGPQVALLSNPRSTQNARGFPRFCEAVNTYGGVFHFELDDFSSIPEALRQIARIEPAMLIINGGDGTVQATLTALSSDNPFKKLPPLAVLPSGKTNLIADDLGCCGSATDTFRKLVEITRNGALAEHLTPRHLIDLEMDNGRLRRVGMFFGAAGMVRTILYCRRRVYPLGLPNFLSHLLVLIVAIFSALTGMNNPKGPIYSEPISIHLRGGGILKGRFFLVLATTLESLVFGMKPFGQTGAGNLKFSTIDARAGAVLNAARALITGSFGVKSLSGINVRKIDEIRVESRDPFTLDGEIFEPESDAPIILRTDGKCDFVTLK